jgi:hypothetical protein
MKGLAGVIRSAFICVNLRQSFRPAAVLRQERTCGGYWRPGKKKEPPEGGSHAI